MDYEQSALQRNDACRDRELPNRRRRNQTIASFNTYVSLTKPGIIRGNLLTAAAGFFLASKGNIDFALLATMLSGLACVIASACVFNNYIDRKIDKTMARTKNRALAAEAMSAKSALLFASALGLSGALLLGLLTNFLTLALAAAGFFFYVVVYAIFKRRSVHGTLIGSISGAIPPVVGYCALSNQLDIAALIIFVILVLWQMPHFYAIALYRSKDYAAASIPVLPVTKGPDMTKLQMSIYIIAFTAAALSLTYVGHTGYFYAIIMGVAGSVWGILSFKGFSVSDNNIWARRMFLLSLIVITVFCTAIAVDSFVNKPLI